jgi:hypothetical protein
MVPNTTLNSTRLIWTRVVHNILSHASGGGNLVKHMCIWYSRRHGKKLEHRDVEKDPAYRI